MDAHKKTMKRLITRARRRNWPLYGGVEFEHGNADRARENIRQKLDRQLGSMPREFTQHNTTSREGV